MTVKDLYEKAKALGIDDEDVASVKMFIAVRNRLSNGRESALCGNCEVRRTPECPYPTSCELSRPACLTFQRRS